jgi:FAD:protein FMN transferase
VQDGMDLLNRTPGYDGIIVDSQRKLHYSAGLAP